MEYVEVVLVTTLQSALLEAATLCLGIRVVYMAVCHSCLEEEVQRYALPRTHYAIRSSQYLL